MVLADVALCMGSSPELEWLCKMLQKEYDLKKRVLEPGSGAEVTYPNRELGLGDATEWECVPKHVATLVRESVMENCKGNATSITEEGPE